MANAAFPANNPLFEFLDALKARLLAGERPESVASPFGYHEIDYVTAEDNPDGEAEAFATVGFLLPDEVYAELNDGPGGTYGELGGLRIYLDEESAS
jgi:hypothetical protein